MTARLPTLRRPRAVTWEGAALTAVIGLSALLELARLGQNGWANAYYSAAVRSMLGSLHDFAYVSFDPGGLVSVDKPPLALWAQTLSAKLFGLSPLSLLVPEALAAVASVALLNRIVARRFGAGAGLVAALALATFPSFVAVGRDNNPDALLVLLMVLACGAALRAIEAGRLRSLLACAALVGLAFNTKMLAAYLVVPGIALAYLVCAPARPRRRVAALAAAGALLAAVSLAWVAFVDLTPASQRPYVGSSGNNSELGLALSYNGVGRVAGQAGAPGRTWGGAPPPLRSLGRFPPAGGGAAPRLRRFLPAGAGAAPFGAAPPAIGAGPFGAPPAVGFAPPARAGGASSASGGAPGPLRLFSSGLGDQGAWLLPFALAGLVAVALTLPRGRRDPRLAALIVLGGWFLTEATVLSFSRGIVHPYYDSALAPGVAALVGAGAVALTRLGRRGGWRPLLPAAAATATALGEIVLLRRAGFLGWYVPLLAAGVGAGVVLLVRPRLAARAVTLLTALLLVAPAAYATTVWKAPVNGIFPAAGKSDGRLPAGSGISQPALLAFLRAHPSSGRWQLLTQTAAEAEQLILAGVRAGSLGGFNGDDRAVGARQVARLVAAGQARYVELGGAFPGRRGSAATRAVERACLVVPARMWQRRRLGAAGASARPELTLYDCAGRAAPIAASG